MPPTDPPVDPARPERFVRVPRPRAFPDPDDWRRWGAPPFPVAVVDPGEQSSSTDRAGDDQDTEQHEMEAEEAQRHRPLPTVYVADRLLVRNTDGGGQGRLKALDTALANLNWELGTEEIGRASCRERV